MTTAERERAGLAVENPATGEVIAHVADMRTDEVAAHAALARTAQPAWRDAGFDARAAVFKRAQKWLLANYDRVSTTITSETGKTYEDAQIEISVAAQSFGFWAKRASRYLADERVAGAHADAARPQGRGPLRAARR